MANWHASTARQIIKRVVATGTLLLDTPAHFGSGTQNGSELILLEDKLTKRPLLPGASIAGALRHYLLNWEAGYRTQEKDTHLAVRLLGTALDQHERGFQSRVIADDALGTGMMTIREGVKIAGDTRTADDGALFAFQVWSPGTTFDVALELHLLASDGDAAERYEHVFAVALQALQRGEIRMGARKHRGYGRCHIDEWHISEYDMRDKAHFLAWVNNDPLPNTADTYLQPSDDFTDERSAITIDALLHICGSILIREGSDIAESAHLTSNGIPVISGTAVAGALRARALKILNTIDHPTPQTIVDDLFGTHGEEGASETLKASRLIIDEYPIEDYEFRYLQNRVKIDRFTGGAFETALFDERPVFSTNNTTARVRMQLRYPQDETTHKSLDAHMGLLLLLFKDLCTEDLPLGGESSIGRGRLRGQDATITIKMAKQKTIIIRMTDNHMAEDAQARLQAYVDTLWEAIPS